MALQDRPWAIRLRRPAAKAPVTAVTAVTVRTTGRRRRHPADSPLVRTLPGASALANLERRLESRRIVYVPRRSTVRTGQTASAGRVSGRRTARDHGQVGPAGPRRRLEDYRYSPTV